MPLEPYKVGDTVPEASRNSGYSAGLQYPYIYRNLLGSYIVWHRHTGLVVFRSEHPNPVIADRDLVREADRLNGINSRKVSAEVLADIDASE